jgi:DNA polymerase (family 10)
MTNNEEADLFSELADLLDLAGELPFKAASYRKVADSLRTLDTPFAQLIGDGRFDKIPGVGKAIKGKLIKLAETGELPTLEKWRKHEIAAFYPWMIALKLKPRSFGLLVRKLEVTDFKDLLAKLNRQDISKLAGQAKETANIIINNN